MKWPWRQEKPSDEVVEIEKSLQETKILIAQAYAGFNSAADPELVESYVYEIQALQARYSYLLRQRKTYEKPTDGARTAPRRRSARVGTAELASSRTLAQKAIVPEQPRTEEGPVLPVLPVA